MNDLSVIRKQLVLAVEFMAAIGDDDSWAGEMPAKPGNFVPGIWQWVNRPVHVIWEDFLSALASRDLYVRWLAGRELPIADLLAASREVSDGDG